MNSAEHRANAERLMSAASFYTADPTKDHDSRSLVTEATLLTAQAQVHATLALTPPPAQPPQQRIDTSKPVHVYDIGGAYFEVTAASSGGVVIAHDDSGFGTVIEDPAKIRLFAAALTAHADRLEPKP